MNRVRSALAHLIAVVAVLLMPLALTSAWSSEVVNDEDRWVETVGPLATDPDVVNAVAVRLEDLAVATVDVGGAERALEDILGADLGGAGARTEQALREAVRQVVVRVVSSDVFPPAWEEAMRATHTQLLRALRSDSGAEVSVDLGPLLQAVLDSLSEQGLPVTVDASGLDAAFSVASSGELDQARAGYQVVDAAGLGLPVAVALLAAVALLVSARRMVTAGILLVGAALSAVVVWLGLGAARTLLLDRAPTADRNLLAAMYDVLVADLERLALLVVVAGPAVLIVLLLLRRLGGRRRREPAA